MNVWLLVAVLQLSAPCYLFHDALETGGRRQIVELLLEHLSDEALSFEALPLAELDARMAADAGSLPLLQAYRFLRERALAQFWILRFQRDTGTLAMECFDARTGSHVMRGAKVRSMQAEQLEPDHARRILESMQWIRALVHQQAEQRQLPEEPYVERYAWAGHEDRPHPGFRWSFEPEGMTVTYVYAGSSVAAAGLAMGDRVLELAGAPMESPAHLGRAFGALRPGDALSLRVQGPEEEPREVTGSVESWIALRARWQQAIEGAPVDLPASPATAGKVRLVYFLSTRMPDTWQALPTLLWLQERFADRLQVEAIAGQDTPAAVAAFGAEVRFPFPLTADPTHLYQDRARVDPLPAFVLLDAEGKLRFRPAEPRELHAAVRTLVDD